MPGAPPAPAPAPAPAPGAATSAPVTARFADPGAAPAPAAPAAPAAAWDNGRFALNEGDTVVLIGQENLVRVSRGGELEARLAAGCASAHPHVRCMAWEGDTVYEQWRDLNFGDWRTQLDAVGATVVVVQFGQIEALDGRERLGAFTAAYHRLLDQVASGRRLVLLTPISFEDPLPPRAPRLSERNGDLAAYAEAVRGVARSRGRCASISPPSAAAAAPARRRRGARPTTACTSTTTAAASSPSW